MTDTVKTTTKTTAPVVTEPVAGMGAGSNPNHSAPAYAEGYLETVLENLNAVSKAIMNRYGIHPEGDATEAAAVVIRGLIEAK